MTLIKFSENFLKSTVVFFRNFYGQYCKSYDYHFWTIYDQLEKLFSDEFGIPHFLEYLDGIDMF